MPRSKLITALLLVTVICLGLTALLLPKRADLTPTAIDLVTFPPSQIVLVRVRLPDGYTQQLTRQTPDTWHIQLPNRSFPDDALPIRWPASTDRVRAFLRILDRTQGIPATDTPPPASTTLTISSQTGDTATLGLPATSLGGRSILHVQPQSPTDPTSAPFITSDEIPRLLAGNGILNWLDQRAFAGITGQVTDITVTSAGGTMSLARAGSGWRIESPFAAPAETSLITELLSSLQTLPFANPTTPSASEGEPEPPYAGTTTITLTATTRRPAHDGSIATETTRHSLTTTGPVSQNGYVPATLLARTLTPQDRLTLGPLDATINADRLAEIVRQPAFYIARRAVAAEPTDIQSFTLTLPDATNITLARTTAGWTKDDAPVPATEAAAIDALITLLTQTPAAVTAWTDQPLPQDATHLATITAHGLGGLAIATLSLSVAPLPDNPEDTRAHALLITDNLARYYTPESVVDAVRWVAGLN